MFKGTTVTSESAIRRLQSLAKDWPDTLWIWCADGQLYVMEKENGEKVYKGATNNEGVDPDYILASVRIPSDGGDWEWRPVIAFGSGSVPFPTPG